MMARMLVPLSVAFTTGALRTTVWSCLLLHKTFASPIRGQRSKVSEEGGFTSKSMATEKSKKKKRTPKSLTRKKFESILSSELEDEFGPDDGQVAEVLWEESVSFEWDKARDFENSTLPESNASTYPFIVCNRNGTTGFERIATMKKALFDENENDHRIPISTVSNTEEETCSIVQCIPSNTDHASEIYQGLSIVPLGSILKLRQGVIEAIQGMRLNAFHIDLCPDNNMPKDVASSVWNEILADILAAATDGSVRSRCLSDFFWTGAEERNTMQSSKSKHLGRLLRSHGRSLMWSSALDEAMSSDENCANVFSGLRMANYETNDGFKIQVGNQLYDHATASYAIPCIMFLVARISSHRLVCSIADAPDVSLSNFQASWIVQSGQKDYRPLLDLGLTGAGQVVAVVDSGIDADNCYFHDDSAHEQEYGVSVVAKSVFIQLKAIAVLQSERRKVVKYTAYADGRGGNRGHGTHVAGTIAGRKANGDSLSEGLADGIARDAKLAIFDIAIDSDPDNPRCCFLPADFKTFLEDGRSAGAKIHNASWGAPGNRYRSYDAMADAFLYNNDKHLMIAAAGNKGPLSLSLSSPGLAKNTISVGASQSDGPDLYDGTLGRDYLAFFSSRGPTNDGRIKPDCVAPGYAILSAGSVADQRGECDPENGMLPQVGSAKDGIAYKKGTSQAAPVVSGVCAILRQYFEEGWYPSGSKKAEDAFVPSGALIKAMVLNGAQSLIGVQLQYGQTFPLKEYDYNQGFGRVDLSESLALGNNSTSRLIVFDQKKIASTEEHNIRIKIDSWGRCHEEKLSITLVWTDPPNKDGCVNCVLNDLDLSLTKEGGSDIYYPNGLGKRDDKNNVERIRVTAREGDEFTLHVTAKNLLTDSQQYALVATGCIDTETSQLTLTPTSSYAPTNRSPSSPPLSKPPSPSVQQHDILTSISQSPKPSSVSASKSPTDIQDQSPPPSPSSTPHQQQSKDLTTPLFNQSTNSPTTMTGYTPSSFPSTSPPSNTMSNSLPLSHHSVSNSPNPAPSLHPSLTTDHFPSFSPTIEHSDKGDRDVYDDMDEEEMSGALDVEKEKGN